MKMRSRGYAGFTIVEMLVALGVVSLVLMVIFQVVVDVSNAVSLGRRMSDLIADQRVIAEQVRDDASKMVGPDAGQHGGPHGFLVILNREIDAPVLGHGRVGGASGRILPAIPIRSDQLMFIRHRGRAEPMTGGEITGYSAEADSAFQRVWYGHVRATEADGTDARIAAASDDLRPDEEGVEAQPPDEGPANQWILGRQAAFLGVEGAEIAAISLAAEAPVDGFGPDGGPHHPAALDRSPGTAADGDDAAFYTGVTDLVRQRLDAVLAGLPERDAGGLAYAQAVYPLTFGDRRLRANPLVGRSGVSGGSTFATWRINQTHPILAEQVSSFIVEFAGDYDGTPGLDVVSEADPSIRWYSHFEALDANAGPPGADAGFNDEGQAIYDTEPGVAHADGAFVFRHDSAEGWPTLIRLRYRMHDPRGQISDTTDPNRPSGRWFEVVFRVPRP